MYQSPQTIRLLACVVAGVSALSLSGCVPLSWLEILRSGHGTRDTPIATPEPQTDAPRPRPVKVPTSDLLVGDCFSSNADQATDISQVTLTDCALPHNVEVFWVGATLDGDYPGPEAIKKTAGVACTGPNFEDFIGVPFDKSIMGVGYTYPTETSWASKSNRHVTCLVYDTDVTDRTTIPTVGTLRGAGR